MKPGFYEMSDEQYHADPWGKDNPGMSASLAKAVMSKSLQNAWAMSPHCDGAEPFKPNEAMMFGKCVHALVFGGEKIVEIDADNYKTKAARELRDDANEQGQIPILKKNMDGLETCAELVKRRFDQLYDGEYISEQVALWRCDGFDGEPTGPRRAKRDSRSIDRPVIVDLKTTQASISFDACQRRIFGDGLHIQAAAYIEAEETLNPQFKGKTQFYFQWIEQKYPYALSEPILMDETGLELGRDQWHFAGRLWDEGVKKHNFIEPFNGIARKALPPAFAFYAWEDTKARYARMEQGNRYIPEPQEIR